MTDANPRKKFFIFLKKKDQLLAQLLKYVLMIWLNQIVKYYLNMS